MTHKCHRNATTEVITIYSSMKKSFTKGNVHSQINRQNKKLFGKRLYVFNNMYLIESCTIIQEIRNVFSKNHMQISFVIHIVQSKYFLCDLNL